MSMQVEATTMGYVCPDQLDSVLEETRVQQYRRNFLEQFETNLEALKLIVMDGHPVSIFLSHAWHEDALTLDERNQPNLLSAAKYYDSLCWWLYKTLTRAGFEIVFDKEQDRIRALGVRNFMTKNVDSTHVVLSVCTKLESVH
ncbi:MAG: hypothetical protein K2W94_08000 [Alphaproteobacteria bacterium]|nr:hypothetical protein [Alphaproteobacteria bacterium]